MVLPQVVAVPQALQLVDQVNRRHQQLAVAAWPHLRAHQAPIALRVAPALADPAAAVDASEVGHGLHRWSFICVSRNRHRSSMADLYYSVSIRQDSFRFLVAHANSLGKIFGLLHVSCWQKCASVSKHIHISVRRRPLLIGITVRPLLPAESRSSSSA
jgi:hypothetical protein